MRFTEPDTLCSTIRNCTMDRLGAAAKEFRRLTVPLT